MAPLPAFDTPPSGATGTKVTSSATWIDRRQHFCSRKCVENPEDKTPCTFVDRDGASGLCWLRKDPKDPGCLFILITGSGIPLLSFAPPPSRWLTPPGDDGEKPRAEESCRARTHHARTSIRARGQVHRICAGARKAKCGCRSACWGRGAWGAGDHAWPCNPCIEPSAGHGRNSNDRHPRAQAACLHTRLWTRRRHSLPRSQMQPRPASDNRRGMINTAQCSAAPRTETSSLGA